MATKSQKPAAKRAPAKRKPAAKKHRVRIIDPHHVEHVFEGTEDDVVRDALLVLDNKGGQVIETSLPRPLVI